MRALRTKYRFGTSLLRRSREIPAGLSQGLLRGGVIAGALLFCLATIVSGNAMAQEQSGDCGAQVVLAQPVVGRRVIDFGALGTHGGRSNGIVFETPPGAEVRAPVAGTVVYAAEFRTYGKLVTIAIGCATHVMISGLEKIVVSPGDRVSSGQTLGAMSQGRGDLLPVLYLELRRDGRPIDPGSMSPARQ